ncbi:unnamed protein product, partial [Meganyctiphanes norvegica]
EKVSEELIQLSVTSGVLSQLTAFVGVDNEGKTVKKEPVSRICYDSIECDSIPMQMSCGVKQAKSFGAPSPPMMSLAASASNRRSAAAPTMMSADSSRGAAPMMKPGAAPMMKSKKK